MNYAQIYWNRTCDGEGIRVALYCSGCGWKCKGCHNAETWDPAYGSPFTEEVKQKVLDGCDHPWIDGLSLLGGDPMFPDNQSSVLELLRAFRARFGAAKSVWMWTGCILERDLCSSSSKFKKSEWHTEYTHDILQLVDVIVDGPFIEALKMPNLKWRGSTNQRILRMKS